MTAEKNVAVSFRVSSRFKHLLESASALERRSQTNMLETLLFNYCEQRGIEADWPKSNNDKAPKK